MVLNHIHDNFKYLFDFSFEDKLNRFNQSKHLNLKMPDFYKAINSRDPFSLSSKLRKSNNIGNFFGNVNNFIPIIARNRKLMVMLLI